MNKIFISTVILGLILGLASQAVAQADLPDLKAAGLSDETIGRWLTQSLEPGRLNPPPGADLLTGLSHRGGDALASAYLDMDRRTAHQSRPDMSLEMVKALLAGGLPAAEFFRLFGATKEVNFEQAAADPAPSNQASADQIQADLAPPAPAVKTPARPKPGYQDLRPGQAADPSLRLPPPPVPYDIRRQRTDDAWMGVTERELADGRLVEVHANGSAWLLGQEVISRPTGHKVNRHYSGRPDAPRSGDDPAQARRNLDELMIISGQGRN